MLEKKQLIKIITRDEKIYNPKGVFFLPHFLQTGTFLVLFLIHFIYRNFFLIF